MMSAATWTRACTTAAAAAAVAVGEEVDGDALLGALVDPFSRAASASHKHKSQCRPTNH